VSGAAVAGDVVRTAREAAALEREPLVILEPLEAFLDGAGLGAGPVEAAPIGDGHSNVTYLLRRGPLRVVLRRPPRGPLPPSAHDVLREARLLRALRPAGVRVPEVLATCDDAAVIGAPFYVMAFLDGHVLSTDLPAVFDARGHRERIGDELVDALVELHAVDVDAAGLDGLGRRGGYLERQVRRFSGLLETNATRPLPALERVAAWLEETRPEQAETTIVHGDFRLGNAMFAPQAPPRVVGVLDWELATLGDPLADLGYLTAMWAVPGDPPNPMLDLSAVTRLPGFADRDALARRYAEATGRSIERLGWYRVLALWKAAIFLEGSYKRFLAGSTDDPYFARLGEGVPVLGETAWALARQLG
jgi:aminoglycoside phosphotransferase (APT) family kinase protein